MISFQADHSRIKKDSHLVDLIKKRDINGLGALYDIYAPTILLRILRREKELKVAENMLEKCFINSWQNIDEYNSNELLLTWLVRLIPKVQNPDHHLSR